MDLLEATITPPRSPMEQPSVAEEDQVGSSDHVAGAWGTSPTLEAVEEVAATASVVSAGFSTTALLFEDRAEMVTPPTLRDAGLESSLGVERVELLGIFRLQMVQGSSLVLAPRELPHSLSRCL